MAYNYSDAGNGGFPGTGNIEFDNTTDANATEISIHPNDRNGTDYEDFLDSLDNYGSPNNIGLITIQSASNPSKIAIYKLTDKQKRSAFGAEWFEFGISSVQTTTDFTNGETVNLLFNLFGNDLQTLQSNIVPDADNTRALGTSSKRFTTLHSAALNTGDIIMKNENGHFTIDEQDDFIRVYNHKTGKYYKLLMEEL